MINRYLPVHSESALKTGCLCGQELRNCFKGVQLILHAGDVGHNGGEAGTVPTDCRKVGTLFGLSVAEQRGSKILQEFYNDLSKSLLCKPYGATWTTVKPQSCRLAVL